MTEDINFVIEQTITSLKAAKRRAKDASPELQAEALDALCEINEKARGVWEDLGRDPQQRLPGVSK